MIQMPRPELAHEHTWHLVAVDFDDTTEVQEYECICGQSWFATA